MNEVVKYHNDLNTLSVGGLTENQMNILFTIFSKIKNKDTKEINLDTQQIIELADIPTQNKEYVTNLIMKTFDKLQNLKIRYSTEEYDIQEVIFPRVKAGKHNEEISVKVSEGFAYIFNNLVSNFTRFELAEFVNLQSKYAKTLYRLLKQYRRTGEFRTSWERFVDVMGIPNTYAMRDIEKIILKPITKELQREQNLFDQKRRPFKNLKFEKCKTKGKGNKITHIKFTFTPQKTIFDEFLDMGIIVPELGTNEVRKIISVKEHHEDKYTALVKVEGDERDIKITYDQLKENAVEIKSA